jgi:hypothetical protein
MEERRDEKKSTELFAQASQRAGYSAELNLASSPEMI